MNSMLSQDYVAWRIMKAIRQNEEVVVIPWIYNIIAYLFKMFPVAVMDLFSYALDGWKSMDLFKGRENKNE